MLPKPYRLLERKDFLACYNIGIKYNTKHYIVFVNATSYVPFRLGVTVTKKMGNAVVRNRFKRVVRAFFSQYRDDICGSFDYVVLAKYTVSYEKMSFHSVYEELVALFTSVGYMQETYV